MGTHRRAHARIVTNEKERKKGKKDEGRKTPGGSGHPGDMNMPDRVVAYLMSMSAARYPFLTTGWPMFM